MSPSLIQDTSYVGGGTSDEPRCPPGRRARGEDYDSCLVEEAKKLLADAGSENDSTIDKYSKRENDASALPVR